MKSVAISDCLTAAGLGRVRDAAMVFPAADMLSRISHTINAREVRALQMEQAKKFERKFASSSTGGVLNLSGQEEGRQYAVRGKPAVSTVEQRGAS